MCVCVGKSGVPGSADLGCVCVEAGAVIQGQAGAKAGVTQGDIYATRV